MSERRSRRTTRSAIAAVAALALVALCAGAAALAASSRDATWTSIAKVVYGAQSSDALLGRDSVPGDVDRTLATQAEIVLGDTVMSAAAENLDVGKGALTRNTEVENLTASNVLTISTTATSAAEATRRAQGVTAEYVAMARGQARQSLNDQAAALDQPIADLRAVIAAAPVRGQGSDTAGLSASLNTLIQQQSQLRAASGTETGPVQVLAAAQSPESPSSVSVTTAAVVGAGLGLALLLGLWLVLTWSRTNGDGSRVAPPA